MSTSQAGDAASVGFGLRRAFWLCAAFGLAAVWAPHFPAGVDLPQHANLFHIWASLGDGKSGYRFFYEISWFTPYLLTYLLALPLTKIGGALFAIKVLLSVAVLATPWALGRWLKTIGGEVWWSLWGFVLVFGFGYQWGFISWVLSFPVAFAYLAALEDQHHMPSPRHVLTTLVLVVAIFFMHAVTFAVCVAVGGLLGLLELKRPRRAALELLHLVPGTALALLWVISERRPGVPRPHEWPPRMERIAALFGGAFSAAPSYLWAMVGLAVLAAMTVLARPILARNPRRWLPLLLAALGFAGLPETIHHTWLIGTRFCAFVHGFAPAAFQPTASGPGATRRMRIATVLLVLLALVVLNVRLAWFNRELHGLDEVMRSVEPGSDVYGLLPETGARSEAMGALELGQTMAWVTAIRGGFLHNDSGRYFQIPVQRRLDVAWPSHCRYYLTRGDRDSGRALSAARAKAPVRLIRQSGEWSLFEAERPTQRTGDITVVRYGQEWGDLAVDRAVGGGALTIGGTSFATGLGTHSRSAIEIRLVRRGRAFAGKVGLDDEARGLGRARFLILGAERRQLWSSGHMKTGDPARPFSVSLGGQSGDILLVTEPAGSNRFGHADWVELQVVD
jgi:hypothetical protein